MTLPETLRDEAEAFDRTDLAWQSLRATLFAAADRIEMLERAHARLQAKMEGGHFW